MEDNMKSGNVLTKVLAIAGTIFVGLPILAPIIFSLIRLFSGGHFLFDYLMPAELAFLVAIGGGLLIWAAIRAQSRLRLILWIIGLALLFLLGSQGLAVVTGLADGTITDSSPWFVVVLSIMILYDIMVVLLTVEGILLCRDQFKSPREIMSGNK